MSEMIVILKLDVDIDDVAERTGQTHDEIKAKVRAYISLITNKEFSKGGSEKLVSSAMAEETDICDTTTGQKLLRIVETNVVEYFGTPH